MMKYLKITTLILMVLTLTGCGRFDRWWSAQTGKGVEVCQGGVVYLQFTSGVTVAYNPDDKIKTCVQ